VHRQLQRSVRYRHSVDVTAESVYEAAALGVSARRKSGWADAVAFTVHQIHRWCDGVAPSPDETLKNRRLKQHWANHHV